MVGGLGGKGGTCRAGFRVWLVGFKIQGFGLSFLKFRVEGWRA